MKSDEITEADSVLLLAAFHAAVEGPFFPDWEFHVLMGFERAKLRQLLRDWPAIKDEELFDLAANNVLVNLLGYPHDSWDRWQEYSPATPQDLADLLRRWRGDTTFDASGGGYSDRLR